jgi:hypothetical protein
MVASHTHGYFPLLRGVGEALRVKLAGTDLFPEFRESLPTGFHPLGRSE